MPIDASIYSQIRQPEPVNQLAQYATMMQLQNAAQDRDLKMQEVDRANKLRDLLAGGADPYKAALQVGDLKNAGELAKAQAAADKDKREGEKIGLENSAKRLEIAGNAFKFVADNPTIENAHATLSYLGQHGILSSQQIDQYKASLPSDPAALKNMASMAYNSAIAAKDKLFTFGQANTGGQTVELARNPVTGQVTTASTLTNTQSPDNAATNETTRRGQNMTDARMRDANKIAQEGKVATTSTTLRKEFDDLPEVKNYKQALPAYKAVEDAASRNTTAADINLVYGIAKLYDPNSVVREGEYATIAKSPNIPEKIKGYAQYLTNGGRLTPQVKNEILTEARGRMGSFEGSYEGARKNYESIAARSGGDPTLLFPSAYKSAIVKPSQSPAKSIVRTGTLNGRKVVQYSDGTTDYAD